MKQVTIEITDQVNCRIVGLDAGMKRTIRLENRYFQQWARHTQPYKAGWWDGYEYMMDVGGRTFINQLEKILPTLLNAGYDVDLKDNRESFEYTFPHPDKEMFSHILWPEKHKFEGKPIELMDHQVTALENFFLNPQGVQVLPTSAGKTIITAAMAYHCEPFGRTIIIVPNKSLVGQTEEDFKNIGLDVGVYFGDKKDLDKTHTICTWQSLSILSKKSKKDEGDKQKLLELLKDVQTVIVDEVHGAKSKELKNIVSGPLAHCPIRWGLTGTMPKDEYDQLVIHNVIGPVIHKVKPKELQDLGHLSNCHITIKQFVDDLEFKEYHKEHEYLVTDNERLNYIAPMLAELSETGNTLVLVGKIKTGQKLVEILEASESEINKEKSEKVIFISGSMKTAVRKDHYDDVHDTQNKLIIATYGVAAVGINVPRIFNLVLIEPGKSFVRVIQSIGRGLRVAKDKDFVNIWDIASTCKFSKRHLSNRKKYYTENEYPFMIEKINWRKK